MKPPRAGLLSVALGMGAVIVLVVSAVFAYSEMQRDISSLVESLCKVPGAGCPARLQKFYWTEGWVLLWGFVALSLILGGTLTLYRTASKTGD